jgi:membrane protein involved in colicin uptake
MVRRAKIMVVVALTTLLVGWPHRSFSRQNSKYYLQNKETLLAQITPNLDLGMDNVEMDKAMDVSPNLKASTENVASEKKATVDTEVQVISPEVAARLKKAKMIAELEEKLRTYEAMIMPYIGYRSFRLDEQDQRQLYSRAEIGLKFAWFFGEAWRLENQLGLVSTRQELPWGFIGNPKTIVPYAMHVSWQLYSLYGFDIAVLAGLTGDMQSLNKGTRMQVGFRFKYTLSKKESFRLESMDTLVALGFEHNLDVLQPQRLVALLDVASAIYYQKFEKENYVDLEKNWARFEINDISEFDFMRAYKDNRWQYERIKDDVFLVPPKRGERQYFVPQGIVNKMEAIEMIIRVLNLKEEPEEPGNIQISYIPSSNYPEDYTVNLTVYDENKQIIKYLLPTANKEEAARKPSRNVTWDGTDELGEKVATADYRLELVISSGNRMMDRISKIARIVTLRSPRYKMKKAKIKFKDLKPGSIQEYFASQAYEKKIIKFEKKSKKDQKIGDKEYVLNKDERMTRCAFLKMLAGALDRINVQTNSNINLLFFDDFNEIPSKDVKMISKCVSAFGGGIEMGIFKSVAKLRPKEELRRYEAAVLINKLYKLKKDPYNLFFKEQNFEKLNKTAQARAEEIERLKQEKEEQGRLAAAEKEKLAAEERARAEAAEKARIEAELKAQQDAEQKAKAEEEEKAKLEAEQKAKEEAEKKAQQEAELKAKEEAELKAQQEAELKAKEEAELKAKREAEAAAAAAAAAAQAKAKTPTKDKKEAVTVTKDVKKPLVRKPRKPKRRQKIKNDSIKRVLSESKMLLGAQGYKEISGTHYAVLIGSFTDKAKAEKYMQKFKKYSNSVSLIERGSGIGKIYTVHIASFKKKRDANEVSQRFNDMKIYTYVKRIEQPPKITTPNATAEKGEEQDEATREEARRQAEEEKRLAAEKAKQEALAAEEERKREEEARAVAEAEERERRKQEAEERRKAALARQAEEALKEIERADLAASKRLASQEVQGELNSTMKITQKSLDMIRASKAINYKSIFGTTYAVLFGSFTTQSKAQNYVQQLKKASAAISLIERESGIGIISTIHIGSFNNKREADRLSKNLNDIGIFSYVSEIENPPPPPSPNVSE